MRRISIEHFGPIERCDLEMTDFMVLTGPQASGKSTIAKLVFFFKNIGSLLMQEIHKNVLYHSIDSRSLSENQTFSIEGFIRVLKLNFRQIFGDEASMNPLMKVVSFYETGSISVGISQVDGEPSLDIRLGDEVWDFIRKKYDIFLKYNKESRELDESINDITDLYAKSLLAIRQDRIAIKTLLAIELPIQGFFSDDYDVVYIPAGRSMVTLLSPQLSYLYATMDDRQKTSMDYTIQSYIERVLRLKELLKDKSLDSMLKSAENRLSGSLDLLLMARALMNEILQGEYRYSSQMERLSTNSGQEVRINYASSGQQEALWILYILFDALLIGRRSLFIIEEPESNLFPSAQKLITEFIALAQNKGENQILITTHSPYILGTINNLLYAHKIHDEVDAEKLDKIVPPSNRIDFSKLSAYFLEGGELKDCTDTEFQSIKNEVIDRASEVINEDFENMLNLIEEEA